MSYKGITDRKTTIIVNESREGQTMEQKIRRLTQNGEPTTGEVPTIYTERSLGVMPEYDIRADKMELALEAIDGSSRDARARRADRYRKDTEEIGEPEPTQGTESDNAE